jgi:uncharacterized protein YdaU (DUF1376 family)
VAKAPAFQFYPKDFMTDEHVVMMTLAQKGAYIVLMSHQWLHESIPDDIAAVARICQTSEKDMRKMWPGIEPCFPVVAPGRRANRRMSKDNEDMKRFRESKALAGAAGGKAKAAKQTPSEPPSKALASASREGVANASPPFSVLQPSPATATSNGNGSSNQARAREGDGPKPNPFVGGDRPKWEDEALSLTRQIAAIRTDMDPVEVFQKASGYEGARTSKINPANLSEDRLVNTVLDLRKMLKQAQDWATDRERRGNV